MGSLIWIFITIIFGLIWIIFTIGMIALSIVLLVALFVVPGADFPSYIKWIFVSWSCLIIGYTFAHLNMWKFHIKISKLYPEVAKMATEGESYAFHISTQSGDRYVHQWVKRLLDGEFGVFPVEINNHAKFTLWVNRAGLWCFVMTIAITIIALAVGHAWP